MGPCCRYKKQIQQLEGDREDIGQVRCNAACRALPPSHSTPPLPPSSAPPPPLLALPLPTPAASERFLQRLDVLGEQRKQLQQAEETAQITLNQLELEKDALYRQVLKHQRAVKRFQSLEAGKYMAGTMEAIQLAAQKTKQKRDTVVEVGSRCCLCDETCDCFSDRSHGFRGGSARFCRTEPHDRGGAADAVAPTDVELWASG